MDAQVSVDNPTRACLGQDRPWQLRERTQLLERVSHGAGIEKGVAAELMAIPTQARPATHLPDIAQGPVCGAVGRLRRAIAALPEVSSAGHPAPSAIVQQEDGRPPLRGDAPQP